MTQQTPDDPLAVLLARADHLTAAGALVSALCRAADRGDKE